MFRDSMTFSAMYQFLIQQRKVMHRQLFLQRVAHHLQSQSIKQRHLWMYDYVHALNQHCQENDIVYYISTRSVDHFLKSLNVILMHSCVDDLCLVFGCMLSSRKSSLYM